MEIIDLKSTDALLTRDTIPFKICENFQMRYCAIPFGSWGSKLKEVKVRSPKKDEKTACLSTHASIVNWLIIRPIDHVSYFPSFHLVYKQFFIVINPVV